jgi:hypothetical protein
MNAPQSFVICTLPVSFVFTMPSILLCWVHLLVFMIMSVFLLGNTTSMTIPFGTQDHYDMRWSSYVCTSVTTHLQFPFTEAWYADVVDYRQTLIYVHHLLEREALKSIPIKIKLHLGFFFDTNESPNLTLVIIRWAILVTITILNKSILVSLCY